MKRKNCNSVSSYQVSKWLNLSCNLAIFEIQELYEALGKPKWVLCGKVFSEEDNVQNAFDYWLEEYAKGNVLPALLTQDENAYEKFALPDGKFIVRPIFPLIQIKEHRIVIAHDQSIHSGVFGPDSIPFGITFSYPQLILDHNQKKVVEVLKAPYLNTELFKSLQKWVRNFTSPTPFVIDGKKRFEPFRIGKKNEARVF